MRIVMTFPYALGVAGGGPLDCVQTVRHLRAAGAEVALLPVSCHTVSRYPRPETPEELLGRDEIDALRESGVEVISVPQNPLHYLLDGVAVRKTLGHLMARKRIDAVVSWHQEAAFLPRWLRARGVLFGMMASNGYFAEWYNDCDRLRRFIRTQTVVKPLRRAEVIFARSEFMRKLVVDVFDLDPAKIEVAHCGVDAVYLQAERSFSGDISRFIFFGWLIREKGAFEVLEALAKVTQAGHRDWTLKLIGWGDVEGVRKKARDCGIDDRVVILDRMQRAELIRELEWADVAILPSHGESFGLANVEAQAAGLPVIAYEVGGVPEIVKHGETGWLAPLRRNDMLAEAITAAMADPRKTFEMGLAGRERAGNRFSWQRSAEILLRRIEKERRAHTKASSEIPETNYSTRESVAP